jgi:hypothetical protein
LRAIAYATPLSVEGAESSGSLKAIANFAVNVCGITDSQKRGIAESRLCAFPDSQEIVFTEIQKHD